MNKQLKSSRFGLLLPSLCALVLSGLAFTVLKTEGAKAAQDTSPRGVYLGGVLLSPTRIAANAEQPGTLQTTATVAVSIATTVDVVPGTLARIELVENSNVEGVTYKVSGGQRGNGRAWAVTLRGGGQSETVRYTISSTSSVVGSVQFRVNLMAATNPPGTTHPAAVLEPPVRLTEGLLLRFQTDGTSSCVPKNCSPKSGDDNGRSVWNRPACRCIERASAIIVDVNGDGYSLTDLDRGVDFDVNADGHPEPVSWTSADSDDALLALDRNANGTIDNGAELFGNYTPQPTSNAPNGFLALAEFDKPLDGGNSDGVIDGNDETFLRLRLWQDRNQNGLSEAEEIFTLPELGITMIRLEYNESMRTDESGNRFRYRAKTFNGRGEKIGHRAWEVFLLPAQ